MQEQWELRLRKLERQSRRWKYACLGLICVGTTALLMGAGTLPKSFAELRAERFVVQNELGQPRAMLAHHNKQTSLTLFDEKQQVRFRALVNAAGHPEMQMYNEQHKEVFNLRETDTGQQLVLLDEQGAPRMGLGLIQENPNIYFFDPQGQIQLQLSSDAQGARFTLFDPQAKKRAQFFTLGAQAGFSLNDTAGVSRLLLAEFPETGPLILIKDAQKKTIFTAP